MDYGSDPTCLNHAGHNALKVATLQQQKTLGAAGKHSSKIQAIGITDFLSGLENVPKSAKSTSSMEHSNRADFLSVDNEITGTTQKKKEQREKMNSDPFELSRKRNPTRDQSQLQASTPTLYTQPIMKPQSLPSNHSVFGTPSKQGTELCVC